MRLGSQPSQHSDNSTEAASGKRLIRLLTIFNALLICALLLTLDWQELFPRFTGENINKTSITRLSKHISIKIKNKDILKLNKVRDDAMRVNAMVGDDTYVPAWLTVDDKTIKAKARLKGDLQDHWQTGRWSLRIKLSGDDSVYGMKTFNLQHPSTRSWLNEYAYMEALKREDILAPRHAVISYSLNGTPPLVYSLVEHFSKELLESQRRREGVIIKIDESGLVIAEANRTMGLFNPPYEDSERCYKNEEVLCFAETNIEQDFELASQKEMAFTRFSAFRDGDLLPSQVFDVKRTAMWLALSDLWSAQHGVLWNNVRFFYNGMTGRFEPIGWDGNASEGRTSSIAWLGHDGGPWHHEQTDSRDLAYDLLSDPSISKAYAGALEKITAEEYIEETIQETTRQLSEVDQAFSKDSSYPGKDLSYVRMAATRIRQQLSTQKLLTAKRIKHPSGNDTIMLISQSPLALEVSAVRWQATADFEALPNSDESLLLPGNLPDFRRINNETGLSWTRMQNGLLPEAFLVKIAGTTQRGVVVPTTDTDSINRLLPLEDLPKGWQQTAHEGLNWINIPPGKHKLSQDLLLPKGMGLKIDAGTSLDIKEGVVIAVNGPVVFQGTKEAPVILTSEDSTWGGLVVLQAKSESLLLHTKFSKVKPAGNHKGPRRMGWFQTGGVVFYESDLKASYVTFEGFHTEDALNVVRANVFIDNCLFKNIQSDAFDGDFINGLVKNITIESVGGDGIDISGSNVEIKHVVATDVLDKAISVGEKSHAAIEDLSVERGKFSIVSKDGSHVECNNINVKNTRYALAAFVKKPEMGPATLKAFNLTTYGNTLTSLAQHNCAITIDGEQQPTSHFKTSVLYD